MQPEFFHENRYQLIYIYEEAKISFKCVKWGVEYEY